jgi:cytoskeletal protein RodZ
MHRLRFAILGAVAALALGTASAVAMQQSAGAGTDPDQHGDNVASAARTTCPHGAEGVHGGCVSAVAQSKSEDTKDTPETSTVNTCKSTDASEDKTETKPVKGDKAAKATDKAEDKTEHQTHAACVSAQDKSEAGETPDTVDTTSDK